MSRRILVIEPDASTRGLIDVVLAGLGFAAVTTATLDEAATRRLDGEAFELALVDDSMQTVQRLRASYPRLAVVVLSGVTTAHVLVQLLRLGVANVVAKPFTPDELRTAVTRTIATRGNRHVDALDFAAAMASGRQAIVRGNLEAARATIVRARSIHPFDGESMALLALVAELGGDDDDADRGYRAALALRCDEEAAGPDPYEGLARLAIYDRASAVAALEERWSRKPPRAVADPVHEPATISDGDVVLFAIGLVRAPNAACFFRQSARHAFVISVGARSDDVAEHRSPLRLALP